MKHNNSQDGFTLLEVLMAIVILTIGIFALLSMQTTSIKGNATANRITEASDWGADEIEQIFALKYGDTTFLEDQDIPKDGLIGLDDAQCCKDGKDPAGNTVAGCTAKADSCLQKDNYFVYLNVAEDQPLTAAPHTSKTIRVIVNKVDIAGNVKTVTFDYFRTQDL